MELRLIDAIDRLRRYCKDRIFSTKTMNSSNQSDLQQSIEQTLQDIALQMGQPLDASEAEHLYREARDLLSEISYEALTLARIAGILLVYRIQGAEPEEMAWFKSQLQQVEDVEEVEELIESVHRVDAL
jgi:anthranilate phosphoribosyltransferase